MSFELKQLSTYYSENWKFNNMLNGSKLAVLFPNELRQDGGAFKAKVRFPIITEVLLQESWTQETGFVENNATEQTVELELKENFTSFTKIAKVNVPTNWETWASNKILTINRQEAKELDDFVLTKICSNVKNSLTDDTEITKDNIVKIIKALDKEAYYKHKFRLEDSIILVSSDVMVAIVDSKLSSVMNNIENTNAVVTRILNKYSIVEANVDDYGFQMIAVLPQAFAWASAVETPLQAGEYTQGPYLGQIFTAINKFYNGEIILPEHVLGIKKKETPPTKIDITTDKSTSTVKVGATDTIKVTNWSSITNPKVSSSDTKIATVTNNAGTITIKGVAKGTANCEITGDNANKKTVTITVNEATE